MWSLLLLTALLHHLIGALVVQLTPITGHPVLLLQMLPTTVGQDHLHLTLLRLPAMTIQLPGELHALGSTALTEALVPAHRQAQRPDQEDIPVLLLQLLRAQSTRRLLLHTGRNHQLHLHLHQTVLYMTMLHTLHQSPLPLQLQLLVVVGALASKQFLTEDLLSLGPSFV